MSRLISPHMPAGSAAVALLDVIHAEAEALVHVERPLAQVATRAVEVVHVLVADEAQPGRIVDEPEDELGVVRREATQDEAVGFEDVHAHMVARVRLKPFSSGTESMNARSGGAICRCDG